MESTTTARGVLTTSNLPATTPTASSSPPNGNYIHSCDLESRLRLKIGSLEGRLKRPDYERILEDPLLQFSGVCQQSQSPSGQAQGATVADLQAEVGIWDRGAPIAP